MNHQKIYDAIIQKAKFEKRIKIKDKNNPDYFYYEKHHILPRCLGGCNNKENLVLLTAREHFICHKLLTYIYKGDRKIAVAFFMLTNTTMAKHKISSRDYKYAKELYNSISISEETRERMKIRNKKHCDKCKKEISLSNFSKHISKCKGSDEKIEWKMLNGLYKCPYCNKEYKNIKFHIWATHTDNINWHPNKGKKQSKESNEKRSKSMKEKL